MNSLLIRQFKDRHKEWLIEWKNKPSIFKEKYRLQHAENMKKYKSDLEKWKESLIHLDRSAASEESKMIRTLKKVLEETLYQNVNEDGEGEDEKLMRYLKEKLIDSSEDIDKPLRKYAKYFDGPK